MTVSSIIDQFVSVMGQLGQLAWALVGLILLGLLLGALAYFAPQRMPFLSKLARGSSSDGSEPPAGKPGRPPKYDWPRYEAMFEEQAAAGVVCDTLADAMDDFGLILEEKGLLVPEPKTLHEHFRKRYRELKAQNVVKPRFRQAAK